MQTFLNSPPGPLGSAGQTSTSTQPQNLFNNASEIGNRFGAGLDGFKSRFGSFQNGLQDLKSQLQANPQNALSSIQGIFNPGGLLGNLFGGDGGLLGGMFGRGMFGGNPLSGLSDMFGRMGQGLGDIPQNVANIPQGLANIPHNFSSMFSPQQGANAPTGATGATAPGGSWGGGLGGGGGFLSRFMGTNQGQA